MLDGLPERVLLPELPKQLAKMLEPFAGNEINKLPKPYKADNLKGNCKDCGGYHGLPAAHLDYVGHAALTKRLLETDLHWNWEPLALDEQGLPQLDKSGGLWIKLTVCGMTRLGYGDATGKTGGNAIKELIGDALRNAGMRFGAALDLWHKGDLWEVAEAKGVTEDGVVIGEGKEPKPKITKSPRVKEVISYTDEEREAASMAFDNIESIQTAEELQKWYNTVEKYWDVPVDLAGSTIKKATTDRLAEIRKGQTNV